MANFSISPGVTIREIDQSQYASTTSGSANTAAIVGYAEKGPFEPTLVTSYQDFVETFGNTLKDVPYLAQAASKFFDIGQVMLVARAGNDDDPELYPNAAQYAEKTVRIEPSAVSATKGYQEFSGTDDLAAGSFVAGSEYGFQVVADHKGFAAAKYVETWEGKTAETYNSLGAGVPSKTMENIDFKIAYTTSGEATIMANIKLDSDATVEYQGTGTRGNGGLGDAFSIKLEKYREGGSYAYDATEYISFNGSYGAVAIGTQNLDAGYDWANTGQDFKVVLGSTTYVVSLDQATTTPAEVVAEINAKLMSAENEDTMTPTNISANVEAFVLTTASGETSIAIKHVGGSDSGFSLSQGTSDALVTLGIAPTSYDDDKGLVGRWDAKIGDADYSGDFAFEQDRVDTGMMSFEEAIDVTLTAPANGAWALADITSGINAALAAAYPDYMDASARGTAAVDTATGRIRVTASSAAADGEKSFVALTAGVGNDLSTLLGGMEYAVDGEAGSSIGEAKVILRAREKGSYGNNLVLRVETTTVRVGTSTVSYDNVYVLLNGTEVNSYPKISWTDSSSTSYILTKMAEDGYIELEAEDEDGNSTLAKLPDGDWYLGDDSVPDGVLASDAEVVSFNVGTNGWTTEGDVITSMSSDFSNALDSISNSEIYDFNLVLAPGDASPIVQNAIQDLCESRRDCFGIIDAAPFGLGLGVKSRTNDITEVNDSCSTLTSSYVGAFWPWLQDYDSDNSQYIWLPPSIYALYSMVYTDNTADPWYAPAGLTRGKVSALDVEYSATKVDRDFLYGDTAIVNPIVKFVGEGISIWGQKTAQRTNSSTDRINVRRLMIYTERLISKMARGFLFEQHDSSNWAAFARQANAILEPIRQRNGLYSFTVICDETTNTSDLIDQNIMAGKIYLQPTKTIEFIEVGFTITSSGDVEISE